MGELSTPRPAGSAEPGGGPSPRRTPPGPALAFPLACSSARSAATTRRAARLRDRRPPEQLARGVERAGLQQRLGLELVAAPSQRRGHRRGQPTHSDRSASSTPCIRLGSRRRSRPRAAPRTPTAAAAPPSGDGGAPATCSAAAVQSPRAACEPGGHRVRERSSQTWSSPVAARPQDRRGRRPARQRPSQLDVGQRRVCVGEAARGGAGAGPADDRRQVRRSRPRRSPPGRGYRRGWRRARPRTALGSRCEIDSDAERVGRLTLASGVGEARTRGPGAR